MVDTDEVVDTLAMERLLTLIHQCLTYMKGQQDARVATGLAEEKRP